VFQLGENLVTDATQALLELIKNCYDADASYCKVVIDTNYSGPHGQGQIIVEDDGTGMDDGAITRGWLTISDSPKRAFKRERRKTEKGRTPLGDKGLGRLGTQRLGSRLDIVTSTGDGHQRSLGIDWDDFASGKLLESVGVDYLEKRSKAARGTSVTITGLRDLALWKQDGRTHLQTDLAQIISPFQPIKQFQLLAIFDGEVIDLFNVGKALRDSALVKYLLLYEDGFLKITGHARLDYIRPEKGKKERALFDALVRSDDGASFFEFLKARTSDARFSFVRGKSPWWVQFETVMALEDLSGVELLDTHISDPGPFGGEIGYFSFGSEAASNQRAFADAKSYRKVVQALGGIRVYRDGFGIRLAQDWLRLGMQWTSAGSYYSLRPQNTIGYISISALNNECLEEKTDREGFSDNGYYRNFSALLRYFVEYAADAQEALRRGWNSYKNHKALQEVQMDEGTQPEDLSASLNATLQRAANYRLALSKVTHSLNALPSDSAAISDMVTGKRATAEELTELQRSATRLSAAMDEARAVIAEVDSYLKDVVQTEKLTALISEQVEALREQMRQTHEVIALGLTAEALSHELSAIASDMAHKNDQIMKYLRSSGPKDQRVLAYAEHIRSVTNGIRKELTYLAPSLQYVREKQEDFDLSELLNEMLRYHVARFSSERISLRIQKDNPQPFRIKASKGKMLQIFENLFLNSEYWLKEDLRLGRITFGTISVELKRPFVIVADNGRGIDPRLEESVFEPFVSGKGKGKGRGLGLFIVQQLLAAENCQINLLQDRNKFDRLWRFEMDLRGVLNE
jgi:signal transduction histidine kinase